MRNPERIPEMLSMLARIWEAIPDQRLGQLIVNLAREHNGKVRDPWVIEDEELMVLMRIVIDDNNL